MGYFMYVILCMMSCFIFHVYLCIIWVMGRWWLILYFVGSTCYFFDKYNVVFSGDTLFKGLRPHAHTSYTHIRYIPPIHTCTHAYLHPHPLPSTPQQALITRNTLRYSFSLIINYITASVGRTDLWGGDKHKLLSSITSKLFTLPPHTLVIPGHGSNTTISDEKQFNPFLKANI